MRASPTTTTSGVPGAAAEGFMGYFRAVRPPASGLCGVRSEQKPMLTSPWWPVGCGPQGESACGGRPSRGGAATVSLRVSVEDTEFLAGQVVQKRGADEQHAKSQQLELGDF